MKRLLLIALAIPGVLQAQTRVEGTVLDSLRGRAPLAGAMIVLVEHNRYATSDARGRFRFDSVPNGRVTVGVLHPMLDSLDLQLPPTTAQVASGLTTRLNVVVPPAARLYSQVCAGERAPDGGVVIGRVRDVDDGSPSGGAVVATEWVEHTMVGGKTSSEVMATAVRADSTGLFVLCNVPTQVPLSVRARHGGAMAGPMIISVDDRLLARADLVLSRRDTAASHMVVADSVVPDHVVVGTVTLRGRVTRADGKPGVGAVIGVPGSGRRTIANAEGRFLLDGIAAGTRLVDVRAVGAAPAQLTFHFATGVQRDTAIVLAAPAQTLATVTTRETSFRRSGFETSGFFDRQRMGFGAFATEEELRNYQAINLSDMLARMRGVSIERGRTGDQAATMPMLRGMIGGRCVPIFFVDGVRFMVDSPVPDPKSNKRFPFTDLMSVVRPDQVKAIEVYPSAGGIPAQFDYTALEGCGSIVIWTR
ncbi:MAG TPA: carboxypeptidase regulatory-like domain-containing protein [Gemmatimonas sp.]|uniref:carboxypeptidase regulatory-like domain-containing protein n=1 Tax=Gemmatimonas sp. TaxID=1962908 RepID=UPI002ED7E55E